MIFRQLFDQDTFTYTYIVGCKYQKEAIIIDPVLTKLDDYIQLLDELGLKLIASIDTHIHADHITASGLLREKLSSESVIGFESKAECASFKIKDNESIHFGKLSIKALHTPGHTADSYSFLMHDRIFTGDTLFIRGTGRTDFQDGDALVQYHSIKNKIFTLADETLIYPGHDYSGKTVSTVGEEKKYNPRLQVSSAEEYTKIMSALDLAKPKYIDIAVPKNLKCGLD